MIRNNITIIILNYEFISDTRDVLDSQENTEDSPHKKVRQVTDLHMTAVNI